MSGQSVCFYGKGKKARNCHLSHCLWIVMKKVFAWSGIHLLWKMSSTFKSSKIKPGSDCSKYFIILVMSCLFLAFSKYTGQKTKPKVWAVARQDFKNKIASTNHFNVSREERAKTNRNSSSTIINTKIEPETLGYKNVKNVTRKELIAKVAMAIRSSKEVARKTKDWKWKINTPHNNTNRNVWSRFWRNEKSGKLKSHPDQPDRLRNQPEELAQYDAEIAWREANRKP